MRNGFHVVSGLIFALVAVLQVVRAANQWPVHVGAYDIPVMASWIAAVVAGLLCVWAFASQGKELPRV
jgi:hypothetical protein